MNASPERLKQAKRLMIRCVRAVVEEYIKGNEVARAKAGHNHEQIEAFADVAADNSFGAVRAHLKSADYEMVLDILTSEVVAKCVERVEHLLKEHPDSISDAMAKWSEILRQEEQQ